MHDAGRVREPVPGAKGWGPTALLAEAQPALTALAATAVVAARTAVRDVRVHVGANASADRGTGHARAGRAGLGREARGAAGAAVHEVSREIDAASTADARARNAGAIGAELGAWTGITSHVRPLCLLRQAD